jgi:serine/threonine-protein kinase
MGYLPCPFCGLLHDSRIVACPTTGKPLPRHAEGSVVRTSSPSARRPPAPRGAPFVGHTIGGKYHILGLLGEGGMGAVYEAENTTIGRKVAIKVLHPAQAKKKVAVKRFHQEARAAGRIGHPNICEVYDLGTLDDGSPYLVMERLVGETLSSRIAREGGMPLLDVLDILAQVLSGLSAAHELGIIHRDIKPENVFLTERAGMPPVAKLLDFGVSKVIFRVVGEEEDGDLTRTGMVMGTPYYMSAEQARGERNLDGRVDVYACGVLMYEALTAKRPFTGKNYNALLMAILTGTPIPATQLRPSLPPDVDRILAKAMARRREDRYQTAAEFQAALAGLAQAIRALGAPSRHTPSRGAPSLRDPARQSGVSTSPEVPSHRRLPDVESGSIPVHVADDNPYGPFDEATVPRKDRMPSRGDFDEVTIKQPSPFDDVDDEGSTRRIDSEELKQHVARWKKSNPQVTPTTDPDPYGASDEETIVVDSSSIEEVAPAPPKRRR